MARVSPAISSFNAGEFSPLLDGRIDYQKYGAAASYIRNFLPLVQGPITRRGGTRYITSTKGNGKAWLIPFIFSATQAYVLEFGDNYIRFFYNHAQILSGASVYEIISPYSSSDLTNSDGTLTLDFAQTGDILYITHANYPVQKLSRLAHDSWTIAAVDFVGGPFKDYNTDDTITVYASAVTGNNITLTASSSIFEAGHVGSLFRLKQRKATTVTKWAVGKTVAAGDLRRSDGKTYVCITGGTTGSDQPVHVEGTEYDGDAVSWEYHDPGYGYCKITSVTSGTIAIADVIDDLPYDCITDQHATTNWAFGAWSDVEGYPTAIAFFRERLCFAKGIQVFISESAWFESFYDRDMSGEIVADKAIIATLASDTVNTVQWLLSNKTGLLCGTAGAEIVISEITTSEAFGPSNCKAETQSQYGASAIIPVRAGNMALHLTRSRKQMREIRYDYSYDQYVSTSVTDLSEHITGGGLLQLAYQFEPYSIIWGVRADGLLTGFTYSPEQEVKSWHLHEIGGSAVVESVACIPAPEGTHDELWMICQRTINGQTKRYLEYMTLPFAHGADLEDAYYVDCGLTYDSTAATTISGLDHLIGSSVAILADGAKHPVRTVDSSGGITLNSSASVVQIGFACPAYYRSMRLEGGSREGVSQGKIKRINKGVLRFYDTVGGEYGPDFDHTDPILTHYGGMAMDTEPAIFSGDIEVEWPGDYERDGRLCIAQTDPFPITIIGLYPQYTVSDR